MKGLILITLDAFCAFSSSVSMDKTGYLFGWKGVGEEVFIVLHHFSWP